MGRVCGWSERQTVYGVGVTVAALDTEINAEHPEFSDVDLVQRLFAVGHDPELQFTHLVYR